MKKALMNERPILIFPSLAMKIGFREAAVLQQIHFWLLSSAHFVDGRKWIYNTYKDWHKQFPFWSESTIKKAILKLEHQGILLSANWNFSKMDKTKWYSIDYEKTAELDLAFFEPNPKSAQVSRGEQPESPADPVNPSRGQMKATRVPNGVSMAPEEAMERTADNQAIPNDTTKNTIKKEKENAIVEIISYLNDKTHSDYKPTTAKTKRVISARLAEGFTVADFKKVIDLKTAEWLDDPYWSRYLRPETLFGTKFESYLNQKPFRKKLTEEDFDLDE